MEEVFKILRSKCREFNSIFFSAGAMGKVMQNKQGMDMNCKGEMEKKYGR